MKKRLLSIITVIAVLFTMILNSSVVVNAAEIRPGKMSIEQLNDMFPDEYYWAHISQNKAREEELLNNSVWSDLRVKESLSPYEVMTQNPYSIPNGLPNMYEGLSGDVGFCALLFYLYNGVDIRDCTVETDYDESGKAIVKGDPAKMFEELEAGDVVQLFVLDDDYYTNYHYFITGRSNGNDGGYTYATVINTGAAAENEHASKIVFHKKYYLPNVFLEHPNAGTIFVYKAKNYKAPSSDIPKGDDVQPKPSSSDTDPGFTAGKEGSIYRLYNPDNGEHLYTTSEAESRHLVANGWKDEGIIGNSASSGVGVYRLYNPASGEHLYTADKNEMKALSSNGWNKDNDGNPMFYGVPDGSKPFYRLFNPAAPQISSHHYTSDQNEISVLKANGWQMDNNGNPVYSLQ